MERTLPNQGPIDQETILVFVSALFGACVTAYFVWRNGFKLRQASAASAFRNALSPIVGAFLDANGDPIASIVRYSNSAVVEAVENFRPYVGLLNRNAFERCVAEYHRHAQQYDQLGPLATLAAMPDEQKVRSVLASKLQAILVHAHQS